MSFAQAGKQSVDQAFDRGRRRRHRNIQCVKDQYAKAYRHKRAIYDTVLYTRTFPERPEIRSEDDQKEYNDNCCGHLAASFVVSLIKPVLTMLTLEFTIT
jgi:hypothetical protein